MRQDGEKGPCEDCGERVDVYGSSWCPSCALILPRYVQDRLLKLRNALIDARYARTRSAANRIIDAALQRSERRGTSEGHGNAQPASIPE